MELKRLNAKKVRVGAKNGMTMDEFCSKYDCSVEQFSTRVTQLYGGDLKAVSRIIDQIEANSKKPRPKMLDVSVLDEIEEGACDAELSVCSNTSELDYWRESENRLIAEIGILESRHKALLTRHQSYLEQLGELEIGYEKLREELIAKGRKFDKLAGLINDSADTMNVLTEEWRSKVVELAQVREKLTILERIKLVVSDTGIISAPGNDDFSFNERGGDEWFHELLQDEDTVGDLRLRDVRVLARLIAIVDNATRLDGVADIDVEFDNPDLEAVYTTLR